MHWYVHDLPLMSLPALRQYVAVGKLNSGNFVPPSIFRIKRYGDTTAEGYKLVWCTHKRVCQDLGLDVYQKRWLTINGTPLAVVFKKYNCVALGRALSVTVIGTSSGGTEVRD
ncbi:hypothetical protein ACP70R_026583 [Stipagrostis hirtigluma subsp. patula]